MTDVKGLFSLTKTPQALPGKCGGCGRATDELGFIDTGLQFDYYGALLFCSECVLDMASKFGYITVQIADQLRDQISNLELETITQRKAILGLEEALDGLQAARNAISALTDNSSVDINPVSETPDVPSPTEGDGTSVVEETAREESTGNSEVDGLSSEQESTGVSSNSGDFVNLDELEF